ncbi:hypothetical protein F1880_004202 [Penicillium rolfsii]|nr:hypothetical protein F1880_004202 [Penicillium rolfsii]
MAHQPDKIPWHLLASNLRWSDGESSGCDCKFTSLHPCGKEKQGVQLTQFAEAFAQAIDEAAESERARYSISYEAPDPEDILIDDEICKKIEPYVIQWRETPHAVDTGVEEVPPIPQEMRKASAFFYSQQSNDCNRFTEDNGKGFFNLEILKLLIIHGYMEPVLRVCVHPDVGIESWEQAAQCHCMAMDYDAGWDMLYKHALSVYLCLNIAYCFPESWDPAVDRTDVKDYRHTRSYHSMLRNCTVPGTISEIVSYPHREFFGIAPEQFDQMQPTVADKERWINKLDIDPNSGILKQNYFGLLPINYFLTLENASLSYLPNTSDVDAVQGLLLGYLPPELVLAIMNLAGYTPKRALTIPDDPLHPLNRGELDKHLELCWQIMVRCQMMSKEIGIDVEEGRWKNLVSHQICALWEVRECECATLWHYDYDRGVHGFMGAWSQTGAA